MYTHDPTKQPTPPDPDYTRCKLWAEYLNDDQEIGCSTDLVFEYTFDHVELMVVVTMIEGYGYDKDQAEDMVLNYLNITKAQFEYL